MIIEHAVFQIFHFKRCFNSPFPRRYVVMTSPASCDAALQTAEVGWVSARKLITVPDSETTVTRPMVAARASVTKTCYITACGAVCGAVRVCFVRARARQLCPAHSCPLWSRCGHMWCVPVLRWGQVRFSITHFASSSTDCFIRKQEHWIL